MSIFLVLSFLLARRLDNTTRLSAARIDQVLSSSIAITWSAYNNHECHLMKNGLLQLPREIRPPLPHHGKSQHMAGQSEARAHAKTRNAPAGRQGPAAPGVVGLLRFRLALAGHVWMIPRKNTVYQVLATVRLRKGAL